MLGFLKKKITAEDACSILLGDMVKNSPETFEEFLSDFEYILSSLGDLGEVNRQEVSDMIDIMGNFRSYNIYFSTIFVKSILPIHHNFDLSISSRIEVCIFKLARDVFSNEDRWIFKYILELYNFVNRKNLSNYQQETRLFIQNVYKGSKMEGKIDILSGAIILPMIDTAINKAVFIRYWPIFKNKFLII